jgi:formate-dependent phosphoribosylglycinamide formyltransferase (GAR transformylase)
MKPFEGKRLLILGGVTHTINIVTEAQKLGAYVIVTDYLVDSPAKRYADKSYMISTTDIDAVVNLCQEERIDGILTQYVDMLLPYYANICKKANLPCYGDEYLFRMAIDKTEFKKTCKKYGVPVTCEYEIDDNFENINKIDFPVVVKPVDSSGSRGFSICNNSDELITGYKKAQKYSNSEKVLVEKYMPFDSSIIHYTFSNGQAYFSGMSDKISKKLNEDGSYVMALQLFPSKHISKYLEDLDQRVRTMFSKVGLREGVVWIEAFNNNGDFTFNEMGYRFGGSETYYPVKYFYNIDQLHMLIGYALTGRSNIETVRFYTDKKKKYCILPVHVKEGEIGEIFGADRIMSMPNVYAFCQAHFQGDIIEHSGTTHQVFCYIHIVYDNLYELKLIVEKIMEELRVFNTNKENQLLYIYDMKALN